MSDKAVIAVLVAVVEDCLHQLSTDSDLDDITGAGKYRTLVGLLKDALYAADPGHPVLRNHFARHQEEEEV